MDYSRIEAEYTVTRSLDNGTYEWWMRTFIIKNGCRLILDQRTIRDPVELVSVLLETARNRL